MVKPAGREFAHSLSPSREAVSRCSQQNRRSKLYRSAEKQRFDSWILVFSKLVVFGMPVMLGFSKLLGLVTFEGWGLSQSATQTRLWICAGLKLADKWSRRGRECRRWVWVWGGGRGGSNPPLPPPNSNPPIFLNNDKKRKKRKKRPPGEGRRGANPNPKLVTSSGRGGGNPNHPNLFLVWEGGGGGS